MAFTLLFVVTFATTDMMLIFLMTYIFAMAIKLLKDPFEQQSFKENTIFKTFNPEYN
jgi:hypothetical protein